MPISRQQLLEQLAKLDRRYTELEQEVAALASQRGADPKAYQQRSKELSDLREIVLMYRTYQRVERDAAEA